MTLRHRSAATLLEICVVLAMLGVMLSVAALAIHRAESRAVPSRTFGAVRRDARSRAMRENRTVSLAVSISDTLLQFAVLTNGSITYDSTPPADSVQVEVVWEAHEAASR